ncbi:hypothetical protein GGI42DRAFT_81940 [Trichoderma sp. SZMC 28013]
MVTRAEAQPDGISRCMQPISQDAATEAADPSTVVGRISCQKQTAVLRISLAIHATCDRLPAADLQPSRQPLPDNGNGCISGISPTHAMQLVDDGNRWHEQRRLRSQAPAKFCFSSSVRWFQQRGAARSPSPCFTHRKGVKATWTLSVLQHWPTSEPSCLEFQRGRKRRRKKNLSLLVRIHFLAKWLHMPNATRDTQLLSSTNNFSRILLCRCLHGSHPPSPCSQTVRY